MGEAARRKKLDPNYGQEQLEVIFKPNLKLPVKLAELKDNLAKKGKKWEIGEVCFKGTAYPAVFIPFTKYYQGRRKMYSHVVFLPDCPIKLTQKLIDRISQKVCQQIIDREERKNN